MTESQEVAYTVLSTMWAGISLPIAGVYPGSITVRVEDETGAEAYLTIDPNGDVEHQSAYVVATIDDDAWCYSATA